MVVRVGGGGGGGRRLGGGGGGARGEHAMGSQRVGDYGMCCRIAVLGVVGRLVENVFPRCWWLMFCVLLSVCSRPLTQ